MAQDLKISSVSIEPMKKSNLCSVLGGKAKPPVVTIKHSKVAEVDIRVEMFDILNTGKRYKHGTKTIKSDASGKTVLKHRYFPPCNFYGDTISNYKFRVTSGGQSKTVDWASFSSRDKQIIR